jgi:hypothetical protein
MQAAEGISLEQIQAFLEASEEVGGASENPVFHLVGIL